MMHNLQNLLSPRKNCKVFVNQRWTHHSMSQWKLLQKLNKRTVLKTSHTNVSFLCLFLLFVVVVEWWSVSGNRFFDIVSNRLPMLLLSAWGPFTCRVIKLCCLHSAMQAPIAPRVESTKIFHNETYIDHYDWLRFVHKCVVCDLFPSLVCVWYVWWCVRACECLWWYVLSVWCVCVWCVVSANKVK